MKYVILIVGSIVATLLMFCAYALIAMPYIDNASREAAKYLLK